MVKLQEQTGTPPEQDHRPLHTATLPLDMSIAHAGEPSNKDDSDSRKRPASGSPDGANFPNLLINKRRFVQKEKDGPQLSVPAPIVTKDAVRRVILLNSPFPSPLIQQNRFDLLARLLSHLDILLEIVNYLSPQTLLNLYSISAPFHYLMDSHFISFIMASTFTWAPNADKIFPWWCYRQLCIEDPALRRARTRSDERSLSWNDKQGKLHRSMDEVLRTTGEKMPQAGGRKPSAEHAKIAVSVKPVPSFRWLKMVTYRECVAREIIGWMAAHGHHVPRHPSVEAIKKMWFLMDMPLNGPRVACIHNTAYFTTKNLFMLQMFFMKLDMLYMDPIHSYGGEWTIRQYLLQERGLTTLWNWLRGKDGTCRLDVLRLWVKHGYKRPQPPRPMLPKVQADYDLRHNMPIMGVPPHLVGRFGFECWGLGKQRLLRPDELVMREGLRRKLDMQRYYLRMIAAGYHDTEMKGRPIPEPDEVVLSLIRCRKNKELEEKANTSVKEKGKGKSTAVAVDGDGDHDMKEQDDQDEENRESFDEDDYDEDPMDVSALQQAVANSLNGQG